MVTIEEIQAAYYTVAATGVLVAAAYYINNMRYALKSREVDLCRIFVSELTSESGVECYSTAMSMNWENVEDFQRKYGPGKPEYSRWISQFLKYESMAYLVKKNIVKPETIYDLGMTGLIPFWEKFRDVIETRRKVGGRDMYSNTELLADEMLKIKLRKDPSYNADSYVKYLNVK